MNVSKKLILLFSLLNFAPETYCGIANLVIQNLVGPMVMEIQTRHKRLVAGKNSLSLYQESIEGEPYAKRIPLIRNSFFNIQKFDPMVEKLNFIYNDKTYTPSKEMKDLLRYSLVSNREYTIVLLVNKRFWGSLQFSLKIISTGAKGTSNQRSREEKPSKKQPVTPNDYAILELDFGATKDAIKKAYKRLALKWHPDKCKPELREECEKKFKEIGNAYEKLMAE